MTEEDLTTCSGDNGHMRGVWSSSRAFWRLVPAFSMFGWITALILTKMVEQEYFTQIDGGGFDDLQWQ